MPQYLFTVQMAVLVPISNEMAIDITIILYHLCNFLSVSVPTVLFWNVDLGEGEDIKKYGFSCPMISADEMYWDHELSATRLVR